jgi:hypothetical protein
MAIFYMVFRRRWGLIELLNISLLLAAAVMSLRLLLVQAVITALGLALRFGGLERIRAMRVLVFGALTFAALTLMTWSREAGLYGKLVGTDNPLMMQYMQIKRYLGAPIQVSLGVARLIWEDKHANPKNMKYWKPVTPTFLHPQKEKDYSRGTGIWLWYEDNVDIDKGLTTNSAMAAIYPDMGLVIFPFMSLLSFVGAWVYGRFWTSDGPLVMIALVVLYGFFELWRTYVFNNGFFIFQLTEIGLASVIGAVVYRFRLDYSQALPGWRNSQSRNA